VRFFDELLSWGCLPLSMALGFSSLRTGEEMRKAEKEISGKIENLNAERGLRRMNLPEHLGSELPLEV
jgi:hypothetical protein